MLFFSNKLAVEINKEKIDGLLSFHPEIALLCDLGVNLRDSLCGIKSIRKTAGAAKDN